MSKKQFRKYVKTLDKELYKKQDKPQLRPQCLIPRGFHMQQPCLNAEGYLTPCCWFDAEDARSEDKTIAGFFNPELNIANYDDPRDIVEGEYWQNFFKMLLKKPKKAPSCCWHKCGGELITDRRVNVETRIAI